MHTARRRSPTSASGQKRTHFTASLCVRFPESGHSGYRTACPLNANFRHWLHEARPNSGRRKRSGAIAKSHSNSFPRVAHGIDGRALAYAVAPMVQIEGEHLAIPDPLQP